MFGNRLTPKASELFARMESINAEERAAMRKLDTAPPEEQRCIESRIARCRDEWVALCAEYCSEMDCR